MDDSGKLVRQEPQGNNGVRVVCSSGLLLLIFFAAGNVLAAASSIKCWTNKQKIRECGQVVPPEYAQQRIEVLNERGIVISVIPAAKSKAQLAADARKARREKAKAKRRQQDHILLQTFTTERDLLISRETNLNAITGIINIARGNASTLKNNQASLQKKAGDYERSGKKVPDKLVKDINDIQRQVKENENYALQKEKERVEMVRRFDDDLKRFRKLKRLRPR